MNQPKRQISPDLIIDILKYMESEKIPVPDDVCEKLYEAFMDLNLACFERKIENGAKRKNRKASR